jgi:hypothetical protein
LADGQARPPRRLLVWPFGFYRVAGDSMRPTLDPGDLLVGRRWLGLKPPRLGRVVVARIDGRPLVKRVAAASVCAAASERGLTLLGDNPAASTDSRHFGPAPLADAEAIILFRLGFHPRVGPKKVL